LALRHQVAVLERPVGKQKVRFIRAIAFSQRAASRLSR
jgi:hypothetical protein